MATHPMARPEIQGTAPQQTGGASLSDILTAVKNLVTALNAATAAFISVNGTSTIEEVTTPMVVKTSPGRVASVSVLVAGSAPGTIYDSNQLTSLTEPLVKIPNTVEVFVVNLPTDSGILIVPGTGQTVTVSWS